MKHVSPVVLLLIGLLVLPLSSCERPDPDVTIAATINPPILPPTPLLTPRSSENTTSNMLPAPPTPERTAPAAPGLPTYEGTPTPDPPHVVAGDNASVTHTVQPGETLVNIAQQYGSSVEALLALNDLGDGAFLYAGQVLLVPSQRMQTGPSFKIIPDSELVYGPAAQDFDVQAVAAHFNGYLLQYEEEVEGQMLSGTQIVQLIADRFSVNPRLLLAMIEYRAGWLTESNPSQLTTPMGNQDPAYGGLHAQLRWATDQLNWGYYGRAEGGLTGFSFGETTHVAFAADINDGTAGVQHWLGAHDGANYGTWLEESGPSGFFATYSRLFGNPFAYTVDPLWPETLQQPPMTLPWAAGETWYFTGGPHGGWAPGSAWAALDFVPHHEQLGCYPSDAWVRAMAPGIVTRSSFGGVVVDLDGDGYAGSGWAVTYMHLENRDRVVVGTQVEAGTPLGHPSCEGGFSNGTHVHIARTYNGRWVSADGDVPFVMGGWESRGLGREYDGLLVRGEAVQEACECRGEENAITAD